MDIREYFWSELSRRSRVGIIASVLILAFSVIGVMAGPLWIAEEANDSRIDEIASGPPYSGGDNITEDYQLRMVLSHTTYKDGEVGSMHKYARTKKFDAETNRILWSSYPFEEFDSTGWGTGVVSTNYAIIQDNGNASKYNRARYKNESGIREPGSEPGMELPEDACLLSDDSFVIHTTLPSSELYSVEKSLATMPFKLLDEMVSVDESVSENGNIVFTVDEGWYRGSATGLTTSVKTVTNVRSSSGELVFTKDGEFVRGNLSLSMRQFQPKHGMFIKPWVNVESELSWEIETSQSNVTVEEPAWLDEYNSSC